MGRCRGAGTRRGRPTRAPRRCLRSGNFASRTPRGGVGLVDGVQLPPEAPGLGARHSAEGATTPASKRPHESYPAVPGTVTKRYLILAEGRSGDPHSGKPARGVIRYAPDPAVVVVDS